jgi:hypothetical protein
MTISGDNIAILTDRILAGFQRPEEIVTGWLRAAARGTNLPV